MPRDASPSLTNLIGENKWPARRNSLSASKLFKKVRSQSNSVLLTLKQSCLASQEGQKIALEVLGSWGWGVRSAWGLCVRFYVLRRRLKKGDGLWLQAWVMRVISQGTWLLLQVIESLKHCDHVYHDRLRKSQQPLRVKPWLYLEWHQQAGRELSFSC